VKAATKLCAAELLRQKPVSDKPCGSETPTAHSLLVYTIDYPPYLTYLPLVKFIFLGITGFMRCPHSQQTPLITI